ncbi:MAG: ABC transporter substrate-binding protein [Candidatus Bathyarchaeota archaeon]|nr:ABC transporter substrate-binding protein [Candidatus Bathyarchaeota archaeon]
MIDLTQMFESKLKKLTILILLILLSLNLFSTPIVSGQQVKGFYPEEIVYFEVTEEDLAISMIKSGDMDLYLYGIKPDKASEALNDPKVNAIKGASKHIDLLFNPAPIDGELNPFSIKEFRQTIDRYLIDREFVVKELLKGFGEPTITSFSPYAPDYNYIIDVVETLKAKSRYDYQFARTRIDEILSAEGALEREEKWHYNDAAIEIRFFIRSDDPVRKAIGDKIASDFEELGFIVERIYGDLHKATSIIYGSDPAAGEWHVYTEGWATTAIVRYNDSNPAWYFSPWIGNMPGWGEPGYWQYEHEELDDLTMKLAAAEFKSFDERAELLKKSIELGHDEAVRSFIANTFDSFPYNGDRIENLIYDLFGGPWTPWFYRGVKLKGEELGGTLRLGQKLIYQGAYNPVAGFKDLYSMNVFRAVTDPGSIPHPHTGLPIPYRYSYEVETAGPEGKLNVPLDALTIDQKELKFKFVENNVNATTKTTFKIKSSNFHHGPRMSVADFMYSLFFMFEWGTERFPGDPKFDGEYSRISEDSRATFVAFRILDEDAVEMYYNYWHPDESYTGTWLSPYSSIPWELVVIMEDVVANEKLAFSRSASGAKGVEWLDLTKGPSIDMMKESLDRLANENHIPPSLKPYISEDQARIRWSSLNNWVELYGHFLVGNGPYYFYKADTLARQDIIRAFRDPSYPFSPGDFDHLTKPKFAEILMMSIPEKIVPGKEALMKIGVSVAGSPSHEAEVNYILLTPKGEIVLSGSATPSEDLGEFEATLSHSDTTKLGVGTYIVKVSAISLEAVRPSTTTRTLMILSPYLEINEELKEIKDDMSRFEEEVNTKLKEISSPSSSRTLIYFTLGLSSLSLAISVVTLLLISKRLKKT